MVVATLPAFLFGLHKRGLFLFCEYNGPLRRYSFLFYRQRQEQLWYIAKHAARYDCVLAYFVI